MDCLKYVFERECFYSLVKCHTMYKLIYILAFFFLSFSAVAAQSLCEIAKQYDGQADDLRIYEAEFTKEHYQSSITYLENFPRKFVNSKDLTKTVRNSEIWISYDNSLKFVQGYILREIANREPTLKNISAFCDFLNTNGEYSD